MKKGFIPTHFYIDTNTGIDSKNSLSALSTSSSKSSSKYSLITVLSFYNNANNISFGIDAMAKVFGFETKLIAYTRYPCTYLELTMAGL